MEQEIKMRRDKKIEEGKAGRKKVKTDDNTTKKETKGKKAKGVMKEEPAVIVPASPIPSEASSENNEDLINSLDEDDLEQFEDDDE